MDDPALSVEGLAPLFASNPDGPALDPAVYGYDAQQMEERPWMRPGANLSDYFNYGFDEPTWRAYCAMQPGGGKAVRLQAEEFVTKQFGTQFRSGDFGSGGHSNQGLRPSPKTNPCFAHRRGGCPDGDACRYAHGEDEQQQAIQRFVDAGGQFQKPPIPYGSRPPPRPMSHDFQPGGAIPPPPHAPQGMPHGAAPLLPAPDAGMPPPPEGGGGFRMMPKRTRSPDGLFEKPQ